MDIQSIVVTGGTGFLGSHIVTQLKGKMPGAVIHALSRADYDLRDPREIARMYADRSPDIVIHAAGHVGGIGANRNAPGEFFYDNAVMGIELIEHARRANAKKFVCIGTVCSYPKSPAIPFRTKDLWEGYPEETNAPYGLAKKMLMVQMQAYREQYGFPGIYLIPTNLYGPGASADPENGHVIPVLITKFIRAKQEGKDVTLWGDGSAMREFLYAEDAADAIIRASMHYEGAAPLNLGSEEEIAIRDLANMIADFTGFTGNIIWDTSKPNGQPRRLLDSSPAYEALGWKANTRLQEGLARTVAWYEERLGAVTLAA